MGSSQTLQAPSISNCELLRAQHMWSWPHLSMHTWSVLSQGPEEGQLLSTPSGVFQSPPHQKSSPPPYSQAIFISSPSLIIYLLHCLTPEKKVSK